MADVNIDDIVDYRKEYTSVIRRHKLNGDTLTGICPFHDDKNSSFSVDLKTGRWHCFAEDIGGNYTTFVAKLKGIDTSEAYKDILQSYGVEPEAKAKEPEGLTVAMYAASKHLPAEWLLDNCKLSDQKDKKTGAAYIKIPYFDRDGHEATFRKRYANKDFRWKFGSKPGLYGEWLIDNKLRAAGQAILIEGESDSQSLWYMGLPGLGVPGASMFKAHHADLLQGLKLYIHQEPDHGGEVFVRKVVEGLREGGFVGDVFRWSCGAIGCKDPSEVFIKFGKEAAAAKILALCQRAKPVDIDADEVIPEAIQGAPVNLKQPDGWVYSDAGISKINPKSDQPTMICRTPIIITQRLRSLETGEEKVEIAFKRDGEWTKGVFPRSTVFTSRGITALADLGCTVTSENAKSVVSFLAALEAANITTIRKADATSTFGWQPGKRFIPGREQDIVLDVDPTQRGLVSAYTQQGDISGWIETMAPHRERDKFRFILAAAFAAPLLRILKQRIFFVYNWGGSKGGKAQPLDTRIITPYGSTTMGNISVGDLVIGRDGKPHKVTAIYPQGVKQVYRVSFSDGTSTRCCKEHLWTVSTRTRRDKKRGYKVMSLEEMLEKPIYSHGGYNFQIPVCDPVEFNRRDDDLRIPPYLLGALLGDGCLVRRRTYFNNSEDDVIKRVEDLVKEFGGHLTANRYTTNQFELTFCPELKNAIQEYGLNKRSEDKFIPKRYLTASIQSRRDLLAGLMDTDGSVEAQGGSFRYSTMSPRLAEDIQELCRSLGYRTRITKHVREGKKHDEIRITISTDDPIFRSEKHSSRVPSVERKTNKKALSIVKIEPIGKEECQCIMVDSEDHTYLCDDYIVTHNTAALKAALSAWGDPERLMVSFNATSVGLERTASFFCDLPLGIDERQLAGRNQEGIERTIYMIASGSGKIRGSKSGGLQATYQWRTVALATGEEPLSTETSQTGVSTRVLEIYGGPFEDEISASLMHQHAAMNCGWAGPAFIDCLIGIDEADICSKYDEMVAYVRKVAEGKSGSHVSGVAAVALADAMADTWIFRNEEPKEPDVIGASKELHINPISWEKAKKMAEVILKEQMANDVGDVNENAVNYIRDWVLSNKSFFGERTNGTCYGIFEDGDEVVDIFPGVLSQELTRAGYSPRKTLKFMSDVGLIETTERKDHSGRNYQVPRRFDGKLCKFVVFRIGEVIGYEEPPKRKTENQPNLAEPYEQQELPLNEGWSPVGDDEPLPFDE